MESFLRELGEETDGPFESAEQEGDPKGDEDASGNKSDTSGGPAESEPTKEGEPKEDDGASALVGDNLKNDERSNKGGLDDTQSSETNDSTSGEVDKESPNDPSTEEASKEDTGTPFLEDSTAPPHQDTKENEGGDKTRLRRRPTPEATKTNEQLDIAKTTAEHPRREYGESDSDELRRKTTTQVVRKASKKIKRMEKPKRSQAPTTRLRKNKARRQARARSKRLVEYSRTLTNQERLDQKRKEAESSSKMDAHAPQIGGSLRELGESRLEESIGHMAQAPLAGHAVVHTVQKIKSNKLFKITNTF